MLKKLLLLLCSFSMTLSLVSIPVFADEEEVKENDTYYYVALGDSIAAGYSLPGVKATSCANLPNNSKNDTEYCYPHIIASHLQSLYGIEGDLYDHYTNLSTVAAKMEDIIGYLENPDYYEQMLITLYKFKSEDIKYHDLYVEEIKKATDISVNVGNNDLLVGCLSILWEDAVGFEGNEVYVKYNGYTVIDNVKNPILAATYMIAYKLSRGIALEKDSIMAEFSNAISYYQSDQAITKLTTAHLTSAFDYMSEDHLKSMMLSQAKIAEENYPTMIQDVLAINSTVNLYLVSYFSAFDDEIEVNGITYTMSSLRTMLLARVTWATINGKDPINALMEYLSGDLGYALIYLALGTGLVAGVEDLNKWLQNYCLENNYDYIDISNIPAEDNLDPHPDVNGHGYIVGKLEPVIIEGIRQRTVHPLGEHTYKLIGTYPSCDEEGYELYECELCQKQMCIAIPQQDHTFEIVSDTATCIRSGKVTYKCTVCGITKTESISAKGHTKPENVTTKTVNATCTRAGSITETYTCTTCKKSVSTKTTIAALGHNYVETQVVEPTYTASGYRLSKCTRCTSTKKVTIAKLTTVSLSKASVVVTQSEKGKLDVVVKVNGEVVDPSCYNVTYSTALTKGKTVTVKVTGITAKGYSSYKSVKFTVVM